MDISKTPPIKATFCTTIRRVYTAENYRGGNNKKLQGGEIFPKNRAFNEAIFENNTVFYTFSTGKTL